MTKIETQPFLSLPSGHRIVTTLEAGKIEQGVNKDGSTQWADYHAGSLILIDKDGNYVCGPIDFRAAGQLALSVCAAKPLALTMPQASLILATSLIAMTHMVEDGGENTPAPTVSAGIKH